MKHLREMTPEDWLTAVIYVVSGWLIGVAFFNFIIEQAPI